MLIVKELIIFRSNKHIYVAVIGFGFVLSEELCRLRRVLSAAEEDNTILELHNYSYHTKAESNNCSIIHSK